MWKKIVAVLSIPMVLFAGGFFGVGGGAPKSTPYFVLTLDGNLSAERRLVFGSGLSVTDAGANGDYTVTYNSADIPSLLTANTFIAGAKQTFQASATTAPARLVCAALPSSPATGDFACDSGDSNKLKIYDGSAWVAAGGGSGTFTYTCAALPGSPSTGTTACDSGDNNTIKMYNGTSWVPVGMYRTGSYTIIRLASDTSSGVLIRNPNGTNSMRFRRWDDADDAIVEMGTIRGFSGSTIMFTAIPTAALGTPAMSVQTAATNDDPNEDTIFCRATTTDATNTTLCTVALTDSQSVSWDVVVTARRTGGSAGATDDGWVYKFICGFKRTSGTAAEIGAEVVTAQIESQDFTPPTCAVSGGNGLVQVTGAVNNNITWHAKINHSRVGS